MFDRFKSRKTIEDEKEFYKNISHLNQFSNPKLIYKIYQQYALDFFNGDHGIEHWNRVHLNALELADYYNISSSVFELFALFHDSKRENDYYDKGHGQRGGEFALSLDLSTFEIDKEDLQRLCFACANHTKPDLSDPLADDLIVQICWDSDRLDIGRVGIVPNKRYLSTGYAKIVLEKRKNEFL